MPITDPIIVARRKRPQAVCDCGRLTKRQTFVPFVGADGPAPTYRADGRPWVTQEGDVWIAMCRGCQMHTVEDWPQR